MISVMMTTKLLAINDQILSLKDLDFPINDAGFLYGLGVFETILIHDGKIPFLVFHYDRLQKSAEFLSISMPLTLEILQQTLFELIKVSDSQNAKLNLYLTAGDKDNSQAGFHFTDPKLISVIRPHSHQETAPVSTTLSALTYTPVPLHCHKSLSYAPYILEQKRYAPNTPLLTSPDGFLLETPTAAVCCIKDKTLLFPKIDPKCHHYRLRSVSEAVIKHYAKEWGVAVEDKSIHRDDLNNMDEIFLCNAVQGIIPVSSIDGDCALRSGTLTETLASEWNKRLF